MEWWYAENGQQIGPVGDDALQDLLRTGAIQASTLVWHSGLRNWIPYSQAMPDTGGVVVAAPPIQPAIAGSMYCSQCGRSFPLSDLMMFGQSAICADCKPVFTQRLRETGVAGRQFIYAGFWIRFLAAFIDGILLTVVTFAIYIPLFGRLMRTPDDVMANIGLQGIAWLAQLAVGLAYEAILTTKYGGTLGKMALSLEVVTTDGARLTYGRSIGRHFAKMLNMFTLGIGYIIAGFDDQKRGLHDHICGTRVIRKPS